jgi:ABC-type phosphate transport system substrate-binding protein
MDRRTFLGTLTAVGIAGVLRPALAGSAIAVVVNPKNPVRSLGPGELEAIFTTRKLDWSGGARIVAFNCPPHHVLRTAFDARALHLDPDDAARFWIDRRVRGGHPPPRQVPDSATMLKVVGSLPGAIGYVRVEELDASVRVVAEI